MGYRMNKKAKQALNDFYYSVLWYLKKEYKSKYYQFYRQNKTIMINFISQFYWGGESIPNVAPEIVQYFKKVTTR